MFEVLTNNQVLKVEEINEEKQPGGKVIIKEPYTMLKKVELVPDKSNIATNEEINITLQWQLFDLQAGRHFNDQFNSQPFIVNISGTQAEIIPVSGAAVIQFSSSAAGKFLIKTDNPDVENSEVKVVVQ